MERSERAALTIFSAGVRVAMIAAAVPLGWPDSSKTLWQILALFGAITAFGSLTYLAYDYRDLARHRRMIPLLGMLLFGSCFIGCAFLYLWPTNVFVSQQVSPQKAANIENNAEKKINLDNKGYVSVVWSDQIGIANGKAVASMAFFNNTDMDMIVNRIYAVQVLRKEQPYDGTPSYFDSWKKVAPTISGVFGQDKMLGYFDGILATRLIPTNILVNGIKAEDTSVIVQSRRLLTAKLTFNIKNVNEFNISSLCIGIEYFDRTGKTVDIIGLGTHIERRLDDKGDMRSEAFQQTQGVFPLIPQEEGLSHLYNKF